VALWNWYCRVGPMRPEWKAEIIGRLLEKPVSQQLSLTQNHLVDTKFGEKVLNFGSKQQLLLGRAAENDVVLPGNAISSKHARIMLKDGRAYLEDFGGRLGTYLWDKRIPQNEPQLLGNGDQFTIFPYRFRLFVQTSFGPETDVTFSNWQVQPATRGGFQKTSPPGLRRFVLNAYATRQEALAEIDPMFLAALQQRILAPLGIERIKTAVPSDDTLFGFIMLAFLERLNRELKSEARFTFVKGAGSASSANARGILLSFSANVGGIGGAFRIFLPLELMRTQKLAVTGQPAMNFPGGLSWRFPISAGFVDLTPAEIAQVGLGDLLVIQPGGAVLFPNDFSKGWALVDEGSNFVRFRFDKYFEGSIPVESAETSTKTGQAAVENLPLRLHVVLGERELTLAEVQSLNPGTIIELDANKSAPVRLMVNGRILGEGELVEVEGNLAVKVLGWRSA
jgi:type III secretion system YscQ/HrcQ family protein